MKRPHHSPSSLQLFAASPAMFVASYCLGIKQPMGAPAHRGTAVEAGVAAGLFELDRPVDDCVSIATHRYDGLTAFSTDPRRDAYRSDIPAMVASALEELRPYGVPTHQQTKVTWHPTGLEAPIVGFADFGWEDKGLIVDLKTTEKLPSQIKISHARQVSLYARGGSSNVEGRLSYITPKKRATYRLENIREHCNALHRLAMTCERFLALSDDPKDLIAMTAPDVEHFYWSAPQARQLAYDVWGV